MSRKKHTYSIYATSSIVVNYNVLDFSIILIDESKKQVSIPLTFKVTNNGDGGKSLLELYQGNERIWHRLK